MRNFWEKFLDSGLLQKTNETNSKIYNSIMIIIEFFILDFFFNQENIDQ